ncbi:hypothetical protein GCM10029976_031820 [Kribbella albertanoniae]
MVADVSAVIHTDDDEGCSDCDCERRTNYREYHSPGGAVRNRRHATAVHRQTLQSPFGPSSPSRQGGRRRYLVDEGKQCAGQRRWPVLPAGVIISSHLDQVTHLLITPDKQGHGAECVHQTLADSNE